MRVPSEACAFSSEVCVKRASEGGASEKPGIVILGTEVHFRKIESCFRGSFQDAPAQIELRGFEAGGGGGGGEAFGNPASD
jgi:hypothetical protein